MSKPRDINVPKTQKVEAEKSQYYLLDQVSSTYFALEVYLTLPSK